MKKALLPEVAAALNPDGARIMIGRLIGVGTPRRIIDALVASGMGGVMDLATGARRVIAPIQHVADGAGHIVRRCDMPVTSTRPIDLLDIYMAVHAVAGSRLLVAETTPALTSDDLANETEGRFEIADDLLTMAQPHVGA